MNSTVKIILGFASIALLYYGAEFLIRGGVAIAKKARISPLVIGLTLVAFATSTPELVVSSAAAWRGLGDISLGNVVGSNICNILLILGLSALVSPLPVNKKLFRIDVPLMCISAIALTILCLMCGGVGRIAAFCFLVTMITYVVWNVRTTHAEGTEYESEDGTAEKPLPLWKASFLVALGLFCLTAGGHFLVEAAVLLAKWCHVTDAVIGLTVVAVGTSLPELATSLVAALKRQQDIAIGNIVGSNIFNTLAILGIAPLIHPIHSVNIVPVDLYVMCGASFILVFVMYTKYTISRKEGAVLSFCYLAYLTWLILQN